MRRIYTKIVILAKKGWYWYLDYLYVTFWQLHSFFIHINPSIYNQTKEVSSSLPSILLISGIYENWQFMNPVAAFLHKNGYRVYVVPELRRTTSSIDELARRTSNYIDEQNLQDCIVIAHSKGGLVGKYLLSFLNQRQSIRGMVSINTPFSGSTYAYLIPLKSIRIFLPNSPSLKELNDNPLVNKNIISIYSIFDPHIPKGSFLHGATNIELATYGHFRIMHSQQLHQTVLKSLNSFSKH